MSTPVLAIVWHSRTGASEALAHAAAAGAGEQGRLFAAEQTTAAQLHEAAGYLFVCPENLGTMSGPMKDMFDRCYYPLLDAVAGRAYATIIAAGSDGQGAQRQVDRIVTGWRLRRVAEPQIVNLAAQTPAAILASKTVPDQALQQARLLGEALASGLSMGLF